MTNRSTPAMGRHTQDIDSADWNRAREDAADLRGLGNDQSMSVETVAALAAKWQVSRATVWRRVRAYRQHGNLTGLLPGAKGRKAGVPSLSADVDTLIRSVARAWWRRTENATIAEIGPSVREQVVGAGLSPPSRATLARRLATLREDPDNFSGEVRQVMRERRRLMTSSYDVSAPLDVVQIDHTVADVFIVDPVSRECIGRPTLTLAIDVATRCVLGHCLSLESPSSLLVALCLEQAVFPKAEWLASLGLAVTYPMHGLPKALHSDNGEEFHSTAFRRGCDLYGIDTIYRPPGTPRFGGHVERLIGTLMRRVRLLPGNTHSEILQRRRRAAESDARLTLGDLERYLVEEIARYHQRTHRGLSMSPRQAWDRGWSGKAGRSTPRVPGDRVSFRLSFLPTKRRVVGREGIELFGLKYACADLAEHVAPGTHRIVRFDPRDLSRVYLELTGTSYLTVPLRDRRLPALSLWEWQWMRQRQRAVVDRMDGEAVTRAIAATDGQLAAPGKTALQTRRRRARTAQWRELQRLQALPTPQVALEPTLTAPATGAGLAWEILE